MSTKLLLLRNEKSGKFGNFFSYYVYIPLSNEHKFTTIRFSKKNNALVDKAFQKAIDEDKQVFIELKNVKFVASLYPFFWANEFAFTFVKQKELTKDDCDKMENFIKSLLKDELPF